jgi:hypothetical protein
VHNTPTCAHPRAQHTHVSRTGVIIADASNQRRRTISCLNEHAHVTIACTCRPRGIAALPDGGCVITDYGDYTIKQVSVDGDVAKVAGCTGSGGFRDGLGHEAMFNDPRGLGLNCDGTSLIVVDGGCSCASAGCGCAGVRGLLGGAAVLGGALLCSVAVACCARWRCCARRLLCTDR